MRNLLFYKYVEIKDLEEFRESHQSFCDSICILGKILIGTEGINGCITGSEEATQKYIDYMRKDSRFKDVEFKVNETSNHNFKKIFVRIRDEIVTSHFDVDLSNSADYIEPEDLNKLYESGEEFYIIDARNDYEAELGKFENAIVPPIKTFGEWPEFVKKISNLKDKKVITYCTGGIRCEKASAYLKEQGFKDVHQLHGGIIKYGQKMGNNHWEGKCFVFDTRGAIDIDPNNEQEPITQCVQCRLPCDKIHNCSHLECDKRFISCDKCLDQLEHCCSKKCRNTALDKKQLEGQMSCGYCS